ncbi:MAG: glutamate-5-semialdehyde dehydrogenase [Clostridia bacterium]|nr:glutamate-5-semialdehyde dehydrogenase [Clostridia bacterium]MBQ9994848.1 glutamate-5-semialdehyde dehydrogenase [Clostridia bacterium]
MKTTLEIMKETAAVKTSIMTAPTEDKNRILTAMADRLVEAADDILAANALDMADAEGRLSTVMLDRLKLTEARIQGMADGIREVVKLPDPAWQITESHTRADGLEITKTCVPLGVIAIIYESRPNVTSDAAALCIKSGNAVILRSGKDAYRSSAAIVRALRQGCADAGYPEALIGQAEDTSRQSSLDLMNGVGYVDLLIPRGGKGLISTCVENAKVPCIETGTGICHLYIDETADLDMALKIIENAKTSRPSVCNAAEVCLVNRKIAGELLPKMRELLVEKRTAEGKIPVELRLDKTCADIIEGTPAGENDFDTEFLDYILAVRAVDNVDEAIAHISAHSTHHSEAIVTRNDAAADKFVRGIDSAAVYVNASTRFTDGGEFGLGCEMGISTQKLHARGPMGLRELCTYKYVVRGDGHVR